jgi:hypothetical protein
VAIQRPRVLVPSQRRCALRHGAQARRGRCIIISHELRTAGGRPKMDSGEPLVRIRLCLRCAVRVGSRHVGPGAPISGAAGCARPDGARTVRLWSVVVGQEFVLRGLGALCSSCRGPGRCGRLALGSHNRDQRRCPIDVWVSLHAPLQICSRHALQMTTIHPTVYTYNTADSASDPNPDER